MAAWRTPCAWGSPPARPPCSTRAPSSATGARWTSSFPASRCSPSRLPWPAGAEMPGRPALVVFLGGLGDSPVESVVAAARWAASLDSIEAALASGAFANAILVTDHVLIPADLPGLVVDLDDAAFHFGRRLADVLRRHGTESVVYMGGGSVPLLAQADFQAIAQTVQSGTAVTNNLYSSDLA